MNRVASRRRRNNGQRNAGVALILATVAGFGGLFYGAAAIDRANGITVSESLANHGIHGGAYVARHFESPIEAPAVEAKLIGRCGDKLMAAMEESAFPDGCAWIEPIREFEAGRAGADHSHGESF